MCTHYSEVHCAVMNIFLKLSLHNMRTTDLAQIPAFYVT
jgi:hypothetical protein